MPCPPLGRKIFRSDTKSPSDWREILKFCPPLEPDICRFWFLTCPGVIGGPAVGGEMSAKALLLRLCAEGLDLSA